MASINPNFTPPYPITPPATSNQPPSYFQQPSVISSASPPPRPPKVPASSHATGSPAPPPPPRSSLPQIHPDPTRRGRAGDHSHLHQQHSNSLPTIPRVNPATSEEPRRKSDEQPSPRRPSVPPSSFVAPSQSDTPPPPPPKTPPQSKSHPRPVDSQISLVGDGNLSSEARRRRRRESKSTKDRATHLSEMEKLRRQKNAVRSKLRILSLDGGGIRGYSTLLLLEALMHDVFVEIHGRAPRRGEEVTKPCEVFDLIGGTGTGGLIAIMLGRLRMSVQTCKEVYVRMTRYVFETDKRFAGVPYGDTLYKASKLERAIRTVVLERTRNDYQDLSIDMNSEDEDWDLEPAGGHYEDEEKEMERRMSLLGRTDSIKAIAEASRISTSDDAQRTRFGSSEALMHDKRKGRCKTMVTAVYKGSSESSTPAIFRTYSSGVESMSYPDCRIWQAGRATCATLSAFKPIRINQDVFLDEGTGRYNPTPTILEEACINEWPGREVGIVISLGTGKRPQASQKGDNKAQWWENLGTSLDQFTQARRRLMQKIDFCETTHLHVANEELNKYGISKNRYFRFNVDVGVGEVAMNEWMRLSDVSTSTRVYLAGPEVGEKMKDSARRMGKLTRDKLKKKVQDKGGITDIDRKDSIVSPVPAGTNELEGVKMEATVKEPVSTVYYEMPAEVPMMPPQITSPQQEYQREQQQHHQLQQMFSAQNLGGGSRPASKGRNDSVQQPLHQQNQQPAQPLQPPKPQVPMIRITPPSVKRPGGRASDVELPG